MSKQKENKQNKTKKKRTQITKRNWNPKIVKCIPDSFEFL